MGGVRMRAALAALMMVASAVPAFAQTGSEGVDLPKGSWTGVRNVVVGADSAQHVARGTEDGAWVYDPRSTVVLDQSNIINNYAAKTAPGVADSSAAWPINGAKNISLRLYTTANDSTSGVVKYQILFLQVRYGSGTVADSSGAFPQVTLRSPGSAASLVVAVTDTIDASTAAGQPYGSRDAMYSAQVGEIVVKCQPVLIAGQRYFTVALPPPPAGETHISVRARVGPVVYYTGAYSVASKWTMGVRVDVKGTR